MALNHDLPNPRRVLMTADTIGGVWTYALDLAEGLGRLGVEVYLATMGEPLTAEQRTAANRLANLTVFESTYKLEWMSDPWEDVRKAGDWLLWLERHLQPDVIHLNGYVHGALPWGTPVLVTGHSCVLSWWRAVKGVDAPIEWNRYWYEVERGLQAAHLVVAPTQAMLTELRHHYGPLANARVIYNGRPGHLFEPAAAKEPFILAAGRLWDEAKNISGLAGVGSRLTWPVYIAGESRHPEGGCVQYDNVQFLGRLVPEMLARWYSRAAIYCLPARYEPFGLSVLEAALSGCALVLGDIPSLRELWNGVATFVPPGDRQALIDALYELTVDPRKRQALADRARLLALEYSAQRMARAYHEAYRELMGLQSPVWEYLHYFGESA